MISLGELIPEWVGDMDVHIKTMLEGRPAPRTHEYKLEGASRLLLECMTLTRVLNDVGHRKGLSEQKRHTGALLLAAATHMKAVELDRFTIAHPDIKKGITCTHLRNDGWIWSRPIRLP